MPAYVLVDTDILIDVSRGEAEALAALSQLESQRDLAVSVITQMELVVGCRNTAELRALVQFLRRFAVLSINEEISRAAVDLLTRYRLSHGLLIADALIAATALYGDQPLISKNQRDYRFITGLQLLPYPQPFTI
jgi:predicted nucleic acid-binding protein